MSDLEVIVESGVLRVTINRPAKRNALSRSLLKDLGEVFAASISDQDLKAAVLRGSGELCFAAGGDLHELSAISTAESETMLLLSQLGRADMRVFVGGTIPRKDGQALLDIGVRGVFTAEMKLADVLDHIDRELS